MSLPSFSLMKSFLKVNVGNRLYNLMREKPKPQSSNSRDKKDYHFEGVFTPTILDKAYEFTAARVVDDAEINPYFRVINSKEGSWVTLRDGRRLLMFACNGYLALEHNAEVKEAAANAIHKYGTSSTGSKFICGNLEEMVQFEEEMADFLGVESVLLYTTGFTANLGTVSTIASKGNECVILDDDAHASIKEGGRLANAKLLRYEHENSSHLEVFLQGRKFESGKIIAVDGVYSMSGQIANLKKLYGLAHEYNAALMVDDAHGIGVLGKGGRGSVNAAGMTDQVHLLTGTLSKSLASVGGFVAGKKMVIDYLRYNSDAHRFAASISPADAAAALAALRYLRKNPYVVDILDTNRIKMKEGLESLKFNIGETNTPIFPIHINGSREDAFVFTKELEKENIFATAIIPPAVPKGSAIIRVSVTAGHTEDEINRGLEALEKVGKKRGQI